MTKKLDKFPINTSSLTGKAAMAGAAVGSAAIAAALLYASRRKERSASAKPAKDVPESD